MDHGFCGQRHADGEYGQTASRGHKIFTVEAAFFQTPEAHEAGYGQRSQNTRTHGEKRQDGSDEAQQPPCAPRPMASQPGDGRAAEKQHKIKLRLKSPKRVFCREGKGQKWRQQQAEKALVLSPLKNPQAAHQSTDDGRVEKGVDRHLQPGIPLAVQFDANQVQQPGEKNSMLVMWLKPCVPCQMALQPGFEKAFRLRPLVQVWDRHSITLNQPEFGAGRHQKQGRQPRRQPPD